jgi:NADH-quinone oxidoreductase subunit K
MPVPVSWYLILSALLFVVGAVGVLVQRNVILMLMGIEIMLNAGNLALVTGARMWGLEDALIYAFLVMTVAAAEAAVGLALVIALFRRHRTLNVDEFKSLSG